MAPVHLNVVAPINLRACVYAYSVINHSVVAWTHLDTKTRWPHISACNQINFEKYAATTAVSLSGLYVGKQCTAPG